MSKRIVLCMCITMCLVAGAIGAWFTAASVRSWYPTLFKPADTPPSWVFGPVWSTLYVLMGTAARLIWQQRSAAGATVALAFFFDQLLLNAIWSFMFFGLHQPGLALIEIVVLLATIITTTNFAQLSRPGFFLMTRYAAWVLYATFLNFGIWQLNRGAP